jgi:hypothetical protein
MVLLQVADGAYGLQVCTVDVNILSSCGQLTRDSPPALGRVLIAPHYKKSAYYKMLYRISELDRIFGTT